MSDSALRIAVIEDNADMIEMITQYLHGAGQYEITGTARNGGEGIRLLETQTVDIAVIDLLMPEKDGFYVLEELSKRPGSKPVCIVLSGANQESVTRMAFEKGADYYIIKPFDMELLKRRIDEIWEQKRRQLGGCAAKKLPVSPLPKVSLPEDFVLHVLHAVPVSNTLIGYQYLKTAILLAINDTSLLTGVTKLLYPLTGKKNKTSAQQVERAMRHALDSAWRKGGGTNFVRLMGYGQPSAPKPTTGAFISAVVELYHHKYKDES